jgi:site-specific DNA-methyltransferase (adenine-specific)
MKSEILKEKKLLQNGGKRSVKNKTLSFSFKEIKQFSGEYLTPKDNLSNINVIKNNIIQGDAFEVIKKLPDHSIDLLIVDPPYNLSKTYASKNFNRMSNDKYKE